MNPERGSTPPPPPPPGAKVIIKTDPGDAQGKAPQDPNTTLGGVPKRKFSPKAPVPKPRKETPPPTSSGDSGAADGDGAEGGKGGGDRGGRGGRWRDRGGRGERGGGGRGRGRGFNQQQLGQVYFSGSAAVVGPPPRPKPAARPIDLSYEGKPSGASGGGGRSSSGGPEGEAVGAAPDASGRWMAQRAGLEHMRDKEEEQDDEWRMDVSPRAKDDEDEDEVGAGDWPPPVVDKLEPISVHFGPPTEALRREHEAQLARVFSDGTNVAEEEQDFIFIQLPRRLPVLEGEDPRPAAPPPAPAPTDPPVVVKAEGAAPGSAAAPGEATKPAAGEQDVPVMAKRENGLNRLGSGYLGKMMVHASGKVTMALGDGVVYEVQPGLPCYFAQDVVAMAPDDGTFCVLGNVRKKLVCVPNLEEAFSANGTLK